jgi:hypothetical protein
LLVYVHCVRVMDKTDPHRQRTAHLPSAGKEDQSP